MIGEILAYLYSWCTLKSLIVYSVMCALPGLYMSKEAKKFVGNDELNKKYYAFHRHDVKNWTFLKLFLDNFFLLGPIRYSTAWIMCASALFWTNIIMLGQDRDKPVDKWREEAMRLAMKPHARIHMFSCGLVWTNYTRRPDVDYKEWLGPDWKPSFEGAGLQVANH